LTKAEQPPSSQAAPSPESAQADAQWVDRLLADYARMAEEGGSAIDAFLTRYDPSGATAAGSELVLRRGPGDRHALGGVRRCRDCTRYCRAQGGEQLGRALRAEP
jgi:hypothetical protein